MKKCSNCNLLKPFSEFYKRRKDKSLFSFCKICEIKKVVLWQKTAKGKQMIKRRDQKRISKNPEKIIARQIAQRGRRLGIFIPKKCEVCGNKNIKELDLHHEDYSKPSVVNYVCRNGSKNQCHLKIHQGKIKLQLKIV